jgi:hypothetical protein
MSCGVFAPVVRPAEFILACADANALLVKVHWLEWGSSVATANAEEKYNPCRPSCVAGKPWVTTKAQVKLSHVVPTTSGHLFRTLSWRDAGSHTCAKSPCATQWQAWESLPMMVSKSYYALGAVCPSADVGLAADGTQGSLVWCETVGARHEWARTS